MGGRGRREGGRERERARTPGAVPLRRRSCAAGAAGAQTVRLDRVVPGGVAGMAYVRRLDRAVVAAVGFAARKMHRLVCLDYSHPARPELAEEGPVVCALYSRTHSTVTTASARTLRVWDAVAGLCTKVPAPPDTEFRLVDVDIVVHVSFTSRLSMGS